MGGLRRCLGLLMVMDESQLLGEEVPADQACWASKWWSSNCNAAAAIEAALHSSLKRESLRETTRGG